MTWERWLSGPRSVCTRQGRTRGPEPMRLHRSPARSPVGEIPERPKGTDCKSVGSAFPGSNPGLATTSDATTGSPPCPLRWTAASCSGAVPAYRFLRASCSLARTSGQWPSRWPGHCGATFANPRHSVGPDASPIYKVKRSATWRTRRTRSGCSSMVERQPSKLHTRVRFPSPAPLSPLL